MSSMFLKELGQNQEVFVSSLSLADRGDLTESFYCEYMNFPVIADKSTYRRMRTDAEMKLLMQNVSKRLGVLLSLCPIYIQLTLYFPYKGFFCYRDFYGELRRQVLERLQFEFGDEILLDDKDEKIYAKNGKRCETLMEMEFGDLDMLE